MKNYVIINGINSNTITGLMINELPPITKPEMRTQREEIDGRDGDIITKLGYSAYDKTITIGLFGSGYDVNSIISFFNSEGTIVFSNEPDKYYNFTMLSEFDIERLQIFKTASITFHCQPFKYPLSETPMEIEPQMIEEEDVEQATLNNVGSALMTIDLKGNTTQTGTPTPSTPIPVQVVSGDNTIEVVGKNLLKVNNNLVPATMSGITFTPVYDNGKLLRIDITGTSNARAYYYLQPTNIEYGNIEGNLTLSTTGTASGVYLQQDNYLNGVYQAGKTASGTVNSTFNPKDLGYTHYRNYINIPYSSSTTYNTSVYPMLEKGSTATTYEPYQSQSYNVNLGSLELCKIGDYQDYFYKDSGKWYLHKEIGKAVLNGTENWIRSGNTSESFFCGALAGVSIPFEAKMGTSSDSKTNYFVKGNKGSNAEVFDMYNGTAYYTTFALYLSTSRATDVTTFKNWLGTHNVILYYVLSTPTTTEITDTNLINQLDNLMNAYSYEGTTNVGQTNNDLPFLLDIKALEDGTNELVINNIGNIYAKPTIELEGSGSGGIYLNDNQIFSVDLTDKMTISTSMMEAYNPDTSALLNRQVIGNYNSMTLQPGNNTIKITGGISKATISDYTRWL